MKSKKSFIRFFGALGLTVVFPTLIVLLVWTPSSFAIEGVVEISQKNVPLVITKPGSYRLISNLTVSSSTPSSPTAAIFIDANNVTIDLNGFTISGPGFDINNPGTGGFGIMNKSGRYVENVVAKGGAVMDFDLGVHLPGNNNRVENVRVLRTGHGIFVGRSSVVSQCQVAFCYSEGINTDDGCMVLNNTIYSIEAHVAINTSGSAPPAGGNIVMGNNIRLSPTGIGVQGQGNRIERNTITLCETGIDLSEGSNN